MNKKEMIERLIKDDIQVIKDAFQEKNTEYLEFILRDGMGFNKMSDQGLIEEFNNISWEIN